ncbi:MAG: acyl transferase [Saprospiraceae bacterium]|nr:acyl transferase [Saprospiraceae bacterium]MBP9210739.1 acyl transferase [Saprospiraceae bacterium]
MNIAAFEDKLLHSSGQNFDELALELFRWQAANNPVYREYLGLLDVSPINVDSVEEIPMLPVEAFTLRDVKTGSWKEETTFLSSGTTGTVPARHAVRSIGWYHQIAQRCFKERFGEVQGYELFALLPGYLERPNASLVEMLTHFVMAAGREPEEAFFIRDFEGLAKSLQQIGKHGSQKMLFGVRFALLDFVEQFPDRCESLWIVETGGMKGRKREMTTREFAASVKRHFGDVRMFSEYGMTEMTSQAYSEEGSGFEPGPTMRFLVEDPFVPGKPAELGQRGRVLVIDLANLHTCAFLRTGDMGILQADGKLEVLGRADNAELRGCTLMYDES